MVSLAIGEKVSKKSISSNCVSPLATNLALYLSMEPSALCLILKTHLQPIGFFPCGRSVMVQVLFKCKASSSAFIAYIHWGCLIACLYVLGSSLRVIVEIKWRREEEILP